MSVQLTELNDLPGRDASAEHRHAKPEAKTQKNLAIGTNYFPFPDVPAPRTFLRQIETRRRSCVVGFDRLTAMTTSIPQVTPEFCKENSLNGKMR